MSNRSSTQYIRNKINLKRKEQKVKKKTKPKNKWVQFVKCVYDSNPYITYTEAMIIAKILRDENYKCNADIEADYRYLMESKFEERNNLWKPKNAIVYNANISSDKYLKPLEEATDFYEDLINSQETISETDNIYKQILDDIEDNPNLEFLRSNKNRMLDLFLNDLKKTYKAKLKSPGIIYA